MNTHTSNVTPLRKPVPMASTQGTLALDLTPRLDPPVAPAGVGAPGADIVPIDARVRRELVISSHRFVESAVQIVSGDRPSSQVLRTSTRRVRDDLQRRAELVARAGMHSAGMGRGRRPLVTPRVRKILPCFVAPGIAEVSAVVKYGERCRAVAARFEYTDDRWICTAIEFA